MEKLWEAMQTLWVRYGEVMGKLWQNYGRLWGSYGEAMGSVGKLWRSCGMLCGSYGEAMGRCWEVLGKLWGGYPSRKKKSKKKQTNRNAKFGVQKALGLKKKSVRKVRGSKGPRKKEKQGQEER